MANPQWTQGSGAGSQIKRNTVHTRKNTTLAAWTHMLTACLAGTGILPTPLGLLHAYEGEDTPGNYADQLIRRERRRKNVVGPAAID
jgi:hypothetical protein